MLSIVNGSVGRGRCGSVFEPRNNATADAAYDTRSIYEAAGARGATVVIPPTRTATVSGRRPRSPARDRTIRQVQQAGRRQWKKDSGYHQQARMENAFFRYKLS